MNAPRRRGVCPGLSAPMPTGDGLLVRLTPSDRIPLGAFAGFCTAARRHGNGTIEITARGSLQVRGLTENSAASFASAVGTLAFPTVDGIPIIVDPLDDDPATLIDATQLASEFRQAIERAQLRLAAKVSIVVDGGGRLHLDALPADIRLRAVLKGDRASTLPLRGRVDQRANGSGLRPARWQAPRADRGGVTQGAKAAHASIAPPRSRAAARRAFDPPPQGEGGAILHVAVGGDAASATSLGAIGLDDAADAVVRLLGVIAAKGETARAADVLRADGAAAFRAAINGRLAAAPDLSPRSPAEAIGLHQLRDGSFALGVALAFGHVHADALLDLYLAAGDSGVSFVRTAPGRALLLIGVDEAEATALAAAAERLGFIVRADDPRHRIVACPGRPACASGLIEARALAAEIAPQLVGNTSTIHISGCAKGCAHPAPAVLTVVGSERGCGLVTQGSARATPRRHVEAADLVAALAEMAVLRRETAHG